MVMSPVRFGGKNDCAVETSSNLAVRQSVFKGLILYMKFKVITTINMKATLFGDGTKVSEQYSARRTVAEGSSELFVSVHEITRRHRAY
jgi:hypothetical protein